MGFNVENIDPKGRNLLSAYTSFEKIISGTHWSSNCDFEVLTGIVFQILSWDKDKSKPLDLKSLKTVVTDIEDEYLEDLENELKNDIWKYEASAAFFADHLLSKSKKVLLGSDNPILPIELENWISKGEKILLENIIPFIRDLIYMEKRPKVKLSVCPELFDMIIGHPEYSKGNDCDMMGIDQSKVKKPLMPLYPEFSLSDLADARLFPVNEYFNDESRLWSIISKVSKEEDLTIFHGYTYCWEGFWGFEFDSKSRENFDLLKPFIQFHLLRIFKGRHKDKLNSSKLNGIEFYCWRSYLKVLNHLYDLKASNSPPYYDLKDQPPFSLEIELQEQIINEMKLLFQGIKFDKKYVEIEDNIFSAVSLFYQLIERVDFQSSLVFNKSSPRVSINSIKDIIIPKVRKVISSKGT